MSMTRAVARRTHTVSLPLIADAGVPKQVPVFTGLMPEGFVATDVSEPVSPDTLRTLP